MKNILSGRLNRSLLFISLVINDIKNIFRDKTLVFILFVPLLFIAILKYGLPFLNELIPVLEEYNRIIFSFFCLLTAIFPSFIIAMIMMDERDEDVLTVFRITPLSSFAFIVYRLAFIYIFSFFFAIIMFITSDIIRVEFSKILLLGFLVSFISPIIALSVISLSSNKIEAVTIFKGLNLILSLPILAVLFDFKFEELLGIIPVYWTFQLINEIEISGSIVKWFLPGVIIHMVYLLFFYWRFRKKVF